MLATWKKREQPLDEDSLCRLIERDESESIEFKQNLPSYERIAEYAVGIGNAGGGSLIIGVTDKPPRRVVGISQLTGNELQQLRTSVYSSTGIRVELDHVRTKSGLYVLGIRIPKAARGQVFCTHAGRYLIRVGETLVGMSPAEVSRRLQERPLGYRIPAAAAVVVITVVTGLVFIRQNRPTLSTRDSVVLADLSNNTEDANLPDVVKQALEVKLEESPFLSILSDQRVRETLLAMRHPVDKALNGATAIEVCRRENAKAMLAGGISSLGEHLIIGVNAVDCQTGNSLAREEVEADNRERLLPAVDRLSRDLRQKLGESAASIQHFDTPLERATTKSLDALEDYTVGNKRLAEGSNEQAIRFFQRAIDEDKDFAMAYAKMGQAYGNLNESDQAQRCVENAFKLRDGTSRRENFYITSRYYDLVTGDVPKEIALLQDWEVAYPREWMPRYDLADALGSYFGQFKQAAEEAREAVRLNPRDADMYATLAEALMAAGRVSEAKSATAGAIQSGIHSAVLHLLLLKIALLANDKITAEKERGWLTDNSQAEEVSEFDAQRAVFEGKLKSAREKLQNAAELTAAQGLKEAAGTAVTDEAVAEAQFGNFRQALAITEKSLAKGRKTNILINAAIVFAMTGLDARSEAIASRLHQSFPNDTLVNTVWIPAAKAAGEIKRGNARKAIALLDASRPYETGWAAALFPIYLRGQAYVLAGDGTHAIGEFQKILEHRAVDPFSELFVLSHLGMARAWRLSGNVDKSRGAYDEFFKIWADADPDIPILLQAKAEYAKIPSVH